jgi:hypothetical protein
MKKRLLVFPLLFFLNACDGKDIESKLVETLNEGLDARSKQSSEPSKPRMGSYRSSNIEEMNELRAALDQAGVKYQNKPDGGIEYTAEDQDDVFRVATELEKKWDN